jgi:hypothetical protein
LYSRGTARLNFFNVAADRTFAEDITARKRA